jgi:hypothetical protein
MRTTLASIADCRTACWNPDHPVVCVLKDGDTVNLAHHGSDDGGGCGVRYGFILTVLSSILMWMMGSCFGFIAN